MLIISRKRDEKVVIGDRIWLMIVDIRGDQAQIGVHAPRDVPVHRWEVYQDILSGVPQPAVQQPSLSRLTDRQTKGLLILSRKYNEKIMIGDDISIMVTDIRGDQVSLGIDAPREVPVDREEVYLSRLAARRETGGTSAPQPA